MSDIIGLTPPPDPQPIDVMLGASRMAMRAHETIPGVWLQDSPTAVVLTAKPRSIPLGPLSRYVETFAKDGSPTSWNLRRDVRFGRSEGQVFFTACGALIFRWLRGWESSWRIRFSPIAFSRHRRRPQLTPLLLAASLPPHPLTNKQCKGSTRTASSPPSPIS